MGLAEDLESISLRVHQIAATAGVMAEGQEEPLSHALHLIEETLWEVEQRIERVRAAAIAKPRQALAAR